MKEDKMEKFKENTASTLVELLGFVMDAVIELILYIPRIAIHFLKGLLS